MEVCVPERVRCISAERGQLLIPSLMHMDALSLQFPHLPSHYQVITIIVYVMMGLTEPARLYLGYEGNLREKASVAVNVN